MPVHGKRSALIKRCESWKPVSAPSAGAMTARRDYTAAEANAEAFLAWTARRGGSAQSADAPPSSNRGESEKGGNAPDRGDWLSQTVCIDWLTWCLSLTELMLCIGVRGGIDGAKRALARMHTGDGDAADLVARAIFDYYGLADAGLRMEGLPTTSRFYAWKVRLRDVHGHAAGMIEFGGEHTRLATGDETARVELTGRGVAQFEGRNASGAHRPRQWAPLRAKLESGPTAWLTRVDVACDLYDGQHTVADAMRWYADGGFDNRGQRPLAMHISDMGSGKGSTFQIGSRQSPKLLRVYEKGRELGDKESQWVRFELQLNRAGGRIDLAVLDAPGAALRGAYRVLDFVADDESRVYQYAERARACAVRAVMHLRTQYGNTIGWFKRHAHDAAAFASVLAFIARDGVPPWAREALHPGEWPSVLAAAVA